MLCAILSCLITTASLSVLDEHQSDAFGYRITAPDGWTLAVSEDREAATSLVTLQRTGKPGVAVSVRVAVLDRDATAVELAQALKTSLKGRDEYSHFRDAEREVGEHQAAGLRLNVRAGDGNDYRVEQLYLVREGLQYTLEHHAPVKRFDANARAFKKVWAGFELRPVSLDPARLLERQLAGRCGSELEWAEDWDTAAARARDEDKWVLAYARFLGNFAIADDTMGEVFTEPDVVALIQERFVPFRMTERRTEPLVRRENYGLSNSTFGTTILLARPDGKVVADFCLLDSVHVDRQLLETLERLAPSQPDATLDEPAARLLRQGRLTEADQALEQPVDAREHLLRARLHRRRWQGQEALDEIGRARDRLAAEPGTDPPSREELSLEEAVIRMRMGRFDDAARALDTLLAASPEGPHNAEAQYWRGALELVQKKVTAAHQRYGRLMQEHPDSPWAWKAAARLRSPAFALGFGERLDWPAEEVFDSVRMPAAAPVRPDEVLEAEREAVEFLLAHQLEDGSWASPTENGRTRPDVPDPFTETITALCIQGLLTHCEDPRVEAAVARGLEFLGAAQDRLRAFGDIQYYMDYSVWRNPLVLWCLADCHDAGLLDTESFEALAVELLEGIAGRQRDSGGWSYYVTADLAAKGTDQSISFITAAVVVALNEAANRSVEVPEQILDTAAAALQQMRNPNGTHEYFLFAGQEPARNTREPGAAGRAPVCNLAQWYQGDADRGDVREALEMFVRHKDELGRERGKSLMHSGDDGQGSHYVMFDYAFAAKALRVLPPKEQKKFRRVILEEVLKMRREDGSYLDNPLMGRAYGTGMALQAFRDLFADPKE